MPPIFHSGMPVVLLMRYTPQVSRIDTKMLSEFRGSTSTELQW